MDNDSKIQLYIGDIVLATITKILKTHIELSLGNTCAVMPTSEYSWCRSYNLKREFNVGDRVKAVVISMKDSIVMLKYNSDAEDGRNVNLLDFNTLLPKVMTYHSAKGLQFDLVILPFYNGATDDEERKTLYVAMTRTMHSLYVLYSSPTIPAPLNVPSHLYLKE